MDWSDPTQPKILVIVQKKNKRTIFFFLFRKEVFFWNSSFLVKTRLTFLYCEKNVKKFSQKLFFFFFFDNKFKVFILWKQGQETLITTLDKQNFNETIKLGFVGILEVNSLYQSTKNILRYLSSLQRKGELWRRAMKKA